MTRRNDTAPSNGPRFGIIPRWVARLDLTGADHQVLLEIACHANKETRIARRNVEQIADEVNLDRRSVQRSLRRLEGEGVLKQLCGGGRGRSNEYQIIFERAADAANSGNDAAVSDTDDTGKGGNDAAVFEETAACSDQNSGAYAAPTESEQKERTPPSGERAREGESSSQIDGVDKKQRALLLPINGGVERRLAALKAYNPSAETVEFAAARGVNALDDSVLGKFIDHFCGKREPPADCDAAFRNWIRNEVEIRARGDNARGSPTRPRRPSMLEGSLDRLRGYGHG